MSRGLHLAWLWQHRIDPSAVPRLTFDTPIARYSVEGDAAWGECINQASVQDARFRDDVMRRAIWSMAGLAFRRDRRQFPHNVRRCFALLRRSWAAHVTGRRDLARAEFAAARDAFLASSSAVITEAAIKGYKFAPGREKGSFGPIRKRIAAALKKSPHVKNAELWDRIKARPPRGWTAYESSRLGRYFEGPTPDQSTSYRRFCNIAAEERRALKRS